MTSRVALGLRAKNSPSISVLQQTKGGDNTNVSPSKLLLFKKVPISPAPPTITAENKENNGTQTVTVETSSSLAQTEVSVPLECPKITSEDLTSEKPTAAYWRAMTDVYENQVEAEMDRSLALSCELDESISELRECEEQLEVLKAVEVDVEEEKQKKSDAK